MAAPEPIREREPERARGRQAPSAAGGAAPPYLGPVERRPRRPPVPLRLAPGAVELSGPVFGPADVGPLDCDLTRQHTGEPLGERITVSGRVLDGWGRPVRGQLVELWQANAAGRYVHRLDRHRAPLDPNFTGTGRCLTDDEGHYRFTTIRPGAYPWAHHRNAWRPSHLHFSLFGTAFTQRLVTQMYFPDDPLLPYDAVWNAIADTTARRRLIAAYDPGLNEPDESLGYRWDIVLDGPDATWAEEGR
ncbi:protocatechuate 3,4-dioxygenase subunit beta [Streptomyces cinnamoneus]|uniref:Protocatechuate 3,4-dioxygenase subunit beta n=1 Tax=Streptomyces cinnamoneus TaxID=53446 RepID=A0A2G1XAV3_STRCJ|nr:protocatechuate 3,4-dioxygenase subunit beta [Streptomyces cinnamoneus]PHQ48345.1 protocatechuate 3,4-dioxygenase subunit beta [Streptomyces cinnamoneus]PPT16771.1 protocatechuate 3,4-dioxygenase subunit beta [Streptomyces cinnamoneus]